MRVSQIKIRNVLGIESLDIEPGAVTVVEGRNGVGKTSTIEAIRAVVDGGHDATLLRAGADSGEVVLVLDDETEIKKRITAGGSTLTVQHPDTGRVSSPQRYVQRLMDALSVNPVDFLAAPEKKQAEYLLESLPMRVSASELAAALGHEVELVGDDFDIDEHALDVIERVRKSVYDDRTGVNREAKGKRTTATQLAESLPEEAGDGEAVRARADELAARKREVEQATRERLAAIQAERDAAIEELRRETQRRIDELKAAAAAEADALKEGAEREATAAREESAPELERLTAEIATAEQRARDADRHENTRSVVEGLSREAEALEARSESLTAALERLDALKGRLLEQLPIKGLRVEGGVIYKGDVPFSRLNRAEQVKVAIQLAQLRAGDVKLICVDGLECLDGKTFELFTTNAAKTDLQFVVTRVAADPDAAPGLVVRGAEELAEVGA
jgi:hypothetical protein